MNYPTEGARILAETGKTAMQLVIEGECEKKECQSLMGLLTNREMNMVGGRPSDCARSAARDHARLGCEGLAIHYEKTWQQINGRR